MSAEVALMSTVMSRNLVESFYLSEEILKNLFSVNRIHKKWLTKTGFLMVSIIDTHCHLDIIQSQGLEIADSLKNAAESGVKKFFKSESILRVP